MPALTLQVPALPPGTRLPVLDELKGLAILLVVLYHAGGVLVWRNLLHGDLGVDLFVILSGVGLALGGRADTGAWPLLRRRALRILPPYWLALTVFLVLNAHVLERRESVFNIVVHYLGIHAWFGDVHAMSINDSFWFVTLILSLYAVHVLVRRIARVEHLLLVGALLSTGVALAFFFAGQSGVFGHLGLRLPGFFVGLVLGRLLRDGRLEIGLGPALFAALLVLTYVPYTQGVVFHSTAVGLVVLGAYARLVRPFLAARLPGVPRALRFLGDHSLEIFLWHQPLIRDYNFIVQVRWLGDPSPGPGSMMVGMVVGFAITLLLATELRRIFARFLPA
jgi:peptidoglycan/LPS O-acetylase OafA/YrhL